MMKAFKPIRDPHGGVAANNALTARAGSNMVPSGEPTVHTEDVDPRRGYRVVGDNGRSPNADAARQAK